MIELFFDKTQNIKRFWTNISFIYDVILKVFELIKKSKFNSLKKKNALHYFIYIL